MTNLITWFTGKLLSNLIKGVCNTDMIDESPFMLKNFALITFALEIILLGEASQKNLD